MDAGNSSQTYKPAYTDEIDLFQLCADLWKKRALIILCTAAVTACGVGYAYLTPEVYKAEASLLPPSTSSLIGLKANLRDAINYQGYQDNQDSFKRAAVVSPAEAFDLTGQYLVSARVKREFLNSSVFSGYVDTAFPAATELKKLEKLSELMSVSLADVKKKRNNTVVSIEWPDPSQAAELVNAWVDLAMRGARDELVKNAQVDLQGQIKVVESQLEAKKKQALLRLDAELRQLRDAKFVADKIGLIEPVDLATENLVINESSYTNVMELRSLYLLGGVALAAEISILESRRDKAEKYVANMGQLEEQLARLQRITPDSDAVHTAKIDLRAVSPEERIKPKRMLVMLVSLVLGVMVGFFVALIVASVEKRTVALN